MNEQSTNLRETVRRRYAAAAVKVTEGGTACCGPQPVEVARAWIVWSAPWWRSLWALRSRPPLMADSAPAVRVNSPSSSTSCASPA